jgi:hypothetical protein
MSNDFFDLYVYCDAEVRPDVYATRFASVGELIDASAGTGKDQHCAPDTTLPVFLKSDGVPLSTIKGSDQSSAVSLALQTSGPGYRLVHVKNPGAPFILALSQTYDPEWTASVSSRSGVTALPLAPFQGDQAAQHAIANGTVNAWYLRQNGDYWLTLVYRPQGLLIMGAWLSAGAAAVIVLSAMIWLAYRRGGTPLSTLIRMVRQMPIGSLR